MQRRLVPRALRWQFAAACVLAIAGCSDDDTGATSTAGAAGAGGRGGSAGSATMGTTGTAGRGGASTDETGGAAGTDGGGEAGGGAGGSAGDGAGGDMGGGGAGGEGGFGGAAGAGGSNVFDAGDIPLCRVTIATNTYDPNAIGCNGIVSCRGVIAYTNNSGATLNFPMIRFTVPDGVSCTKTHSTSKWIISDDGFVSHRCAFTTNPATPWNVAPGNTFRFGYDVTAGVAFSPPTDISVTEIACVAQDAGPDGDAAEEPIDASVDSAADAAIDVVDAPSDFSSEEPADVSMDSIGDVADAGAEPPADAATE